MSGGESPARSSEPGNGEHAKAGEGSAKASATLWGALILCGGTRSEVHALMAAGTSSQQPGAPTVAHVPRDASGICPVQQQARMSCPV